MRKEKAGGPAWGGGKRALGKTSRDSPAERWPGLEDEERERWTEEEEEERARDLDPGAQKKQKYV